MMGVIIGLIVGVAAVVGVVMYFNRASTPFTNMQKLERTASAASASAQPQILTPGVSIDDNASPAALAEAPPPPGPSRSASAPVSAPPPAQVSPAAPQKSKSAAAPRSDKDGQRFDFYKILPGQVDAVTSNNQPASSDSHADLGSAKKPYLQLGAFQNQDDADNLKAKLALLGIEATIQSVSVPGKGMLHRVRVGPFAHPEDADRVKAQLRQNGITTAVKLAN